MTATSQSSPIAEGPRRWSGLRRILRLALKELRETLRDRRTIITLVLMPLLVYPLLSLALRQFLLTSFHHEKEVPWRFAAPSEEQLFLISKLLNEGDKLLREEAARGGGMTAAPAWANELGQSEPSLQDIGVEVTPHLEMKVRDVGIDLGLRIVGLTAIDKVRELMPPFQFELIFRANSPSSRRAASFVERRLSAVNQHFLRTRLNELHDQAATPARWRLVPLAEEEGEGFWLGTLIPLILILMTITGAVYPAIDLTAGERERGTLEALMAAPVPRLGLLVAKYAAVVTVAVLTAVVNLTAMTITVASSGLGKILLGEHGLTAGAVVVVLLLLLLFAAFFSAVLLTVTSFARSFKEAQAYLIPLMLVSLTPGLMSVVPGLRLGPVLAVTPLANIVLLARDAMQGTASPLWGAVAVLSTILYGSLALALAARIFGHDAILYGSEGSWSDLFRRPLQPRPQATLAGALTALALVAPLYVIVNGLYVQMREIALPAQIMAAVGINLLLFAALPLVLARGQGVAIRDGFQLRGAPLLAFAGGALLGCSLWALVYDLIVLSQNLSLTSLTAAQLAKHQPAVDALIARWRSLPIAAIYLAFAVAPAVCEEFFFRGYLLGALRGRMPAAGAIAVTSVVFGIFHAAVGGLVTVEHVLGSALLGVALGWLCWTTGSIFPGMVLHALNNGLLLSLAYWSHHIAAWGWNAENQRYLPMPLVISAVIVAAAGITVVVWDKHARFTAPQAASAPIGGTPPPAE